MFFFTFNIVFSKNMQTWNLSILVLYSQLYYLTSHVLIPLSALLQELVWGEEGTPIGLPLSLSLSLSLSLYIYIYICIYMYTYVFIVCQFVLVIKRLTTYIAVTARASILIIYAHIQFLLERWKVWQNWTLISTFCCGYPLSEHFWDTQYKKI